ncbi:MAG TPA: hypothetical protein VGQ81_04535 [Acidobacteriota bacterium]|nr:hypothetical protein [Acidobacteriota bacterium]
MLRRQEVANLIRSATESQAKSVVSLVSLVVQKLLLKSSPRILGVVLLAPVFLFGDGPDYWVKFSAGDGDIAAATVPGGKLRRVALVVGNAGTPGRKDPLVSLTVLSGDGGGKICEVSETIKPPHLENPVAPLAFQIFYPDANPDAKEPDKQQKGHRTAKYKLVGSVTEPNTGSAREDQNESNNRIEATYTAPAGGVASCIKLQ